MEPTADHAGAGTSELGCSIIPDRASACERRRSFLYGSGGPVAEGPFTRTTFQCAWWIARQDRPMSAVGDERTVFFSPSVRPAQMIADESLEHLSVNSASSRLQRDG